jgi:capsular polysaccharide transport system ATP-binding protein|tara:strand:- start:232 stop:882 length:651 start_codon:yes stop_codon:yes gene_type:complete
MISFQNVSKVYNVKNVQKVVLNDASFNFPAGKNIAIMGENGAGKSTITRMISGIELPTTGSIQSDERVSWPLGFSAGFNGMMTGLENIRFVARIYGVASDEVMEKVQNFAELGKSITLPISTYSSGMKARLAFGLSLAIDFDTFLIDEITAVGDRRFKKKSNLALKDRIENARVIMVSHSENTIREYCDSGALIYNSKMYYYDNVAQLIEDYRRYC